MAVGVNPIDVVLYKTSVQSRREGFMSIVMSILDQDKHFLTFPHISIRPIHKIIRACGSRESHHLLVLY